MFPREAPQRGQAFFFDEAPDEECDRTRRREIEMLPRFYRFNVVARWVENVRIESIEYQSRQARAFEIGEIPLCDFADEHDLIRVF